MSVFPSLDVFMALFWYSVCSSFMLIINKVAITYVPFPSIVTLFQLATCTGFIYFIKALNPGMVDRLEWVKVRPYILYIASFSAGIYTNMKALERSNVDTVIVFRCCTPLVVSLMDFFFLKRELPDLRSALSLVVLLVGATGYVMVDSAFKMDGILAYFWVFIYFWLLCFSMTYGKIISDAVPMKSVWGPTLYSNILSIPPTLLFGLAGGEFGNLHNIHFSLAGASVVLLSCVVGVGISYSGWNARQKVSATLYTLTGVMNKMVTVIINTLIWDRHASGLGVFWLLVCVVAGTFYRQAPLRTQPGSVARV